MTNKPAAKYRNRKDVGRTLGKAPSHRADQPVDLSHIRKPIETSIFGLAQVLRLFETATEEVKSYVAYECDIIYECRTCRTIFRSLANFILHKRSYCTELYRSKSHRFQENNDSLLQQEMNVFHCGDSRSNSPIQPDNNECIETLNNSKRQMDARKKKDIHTVINRIFDKQDSNLITEQCLEDVSNESSKFDQDVSKTNIALQKLTGTNAGVFQTVFSNLGKNTKMDFMKTEVMEIHDILENNEAILGSDGKVLVCDGEKNSTLKNNYTCAVCNQKFSTRITLKYHIRYKHNNSNIIYPCTECKETFATTWCVFRHLYKVHQKSTAQVRKLRNLIHDSAIKRVDNIDRKYNNSDVELLENGSSDDKQWINNLESDNDLRRCGGCGRKFDRKAALHSHSQFCAKRIAICNSIKDDGNRKTQTEEKSDKSNKLIENDVSTVKSIRRRKPLVSHKIHKVDYSNDINILEQPISQQNNFLETDQSSNKITIEQCDDNGLADNEAHTFFVGSVAVSKINKANEIEKHTEDNRDLNKVMPIDEQLENEEHVDRCNSELPVINIDENTNNSTILEETLECVSSIPIEVCNTCIDTPDDSELKSYSCKISIIGDIKQNTDNGVSVVPESNRSLSKRSLKYIDLCKQTCTPCKKHFRSYKALMKHMALHFNWYRYQCTICKYLCYSSTKCKQHVTMKHDVSKTNLETAIKQLSKSVSRRYATSFIRNYKRKKRATKKMANQTTLDKIEIQQSLVEPKTDLSYSIPFSRNIQDPLVHQMVMEVIFGTPRSVTQDCLTNNFVENKVSPCIENGVCKSDVKENSIDLKIPPKLEIKESLDISRPIRTRIVPAHKDYLYDMKQILKLTQAEEKRHKMKLRLRSKKHSTVKVKDVACCQTLKVSESDTSINCVQPKNINANDMSKHVTGDSL